MLFRPVKLNNNFSPSNSFSTIHRVLALNQAHIDGNMDGVVHTVNVGIEDNSDPRRVFSRSMRAFTMVSRHPFPLYFSETPASQICKIWEDPFFRGSGCDLGCAKRNATGGGTGD